VPKWPLLGQKKTQIRLPKNPFYIWAWICLESDIKYKIEPKLIPPLSRRLHVIVWYKWKIQADKTIRNCSIITLFQWTFAIKPSNPQKAQSSKEISSDAFSNQELFLERFFNPLPTHLSMTVPVDGSGLMTNLTPKKSLMSLSTSIPWGISFPTRIFETSCGHNAHRRNNKPWNKSIATTVINKVRSYHCKTQKDFTLLFLTVVMLSS
jgi:hypothetical protein